MLKLNRDARCAHAIRVYTQYILKQVHENDVACTNNKADKKKETRDAKALDGQRYAMPLRWCMWGLDDGRDSSFKGTLIYA